MDIEDVAYEYEGESYFIEERALAQLLIDEVVFSNERDVVFQGKPSGSTTVLYVNCSDVFAWACADAEDLPHDQIQSLYEMHMADKTWGAIKWCCLQRKEQPQKPVAESMKEKGIWDESMDALENNHYDKACKERHPTCSIHS